MNDDGKTFTYCGVVVGIIVLLCGAYYLFGSGGDSDGAGIQRVSDNISTSKDAVNNAQSELGGVQTGLEDAKGTTRQVAATVTGARGTAQHLSDALDASTESVTSSKQGIDRCLEILEGAKARAGQSKE